MNTNFPFHLIDEIQVELLNTGYSQLGQEWNYSNIVSPFTRMYYIKEGEGHILPNPCRSAKSGNCGIICGECKPVLSHFLIPIGFNAVSYVPEGTAHEFINWRRSLLELAPLIFKD